TAAALLEEQGAPGEALRAWLRAERWGEVTRLLREDGRSIAAEAARVGPAWPDLLPATVVDEDPWLSTAVARRLAAEGRAAAAAAGRLLEDPTVDGALLLAGRLVQELVDALSGRDVAAGTDRLDAEAERAGATWTARQARVLHGLARGDGAAVVRVADE